MKFMYLFTLFLMISCSTAKTVIDCDNAYKQAAESKNYNFCQSTVDFYRCLIEANGVYLKSKDSLQQVLKKFGCTTDLGDKDEELGVDGGNGEDKNGSGGGRGRDSNNSSSTLPTIGWLFIALVTCFLTTMRNIN